MGEARVPKARARLARRAAPGAAGPLTRAEVIQRPAHPAVGRPHARRGLCSWEVRRAGGRRELRVAENAAALPDEHARQGVYWLRTTEAHRVPVERGPTALVWTRGAAAFGNRNTDLGRRPIVHPQEARADAPGWFAVRADARAMTSQWRHRRPGGTQTTAAGLETRKAVPVAAWSFRTPAGERLRLARASVPTAEPQALLDSVGGPIPERYLPPDLDPGPARWECQTVT